MDQTIEDRARPVEDEIVGVDEDTGEAAGIGGVVGAAIGAVGAGPIGAALGAAGGMLIGAGVELAAHTVQAHQHTAHVHRWREVCADCGATRDEEAVVETPPQGG